MAGGRAIFQAHVDGLGPESIPVDLQWSFPAGAFETWPTGLVTGDNTIYPSQLSFYRIVIIQPPTTNALALKVKGNVADVGYTLQPAMPTILTGVPGTPLILNCAAPGNVIVRLYFLG